MVASRFQHAATFRAACCLVEFGIGEADAWQILCEWNQTHCQPPWTERDLRHKLTDAYRRASPKEDFTKPARPFAIAGKSPQYPGVTTADAESKSPITDLRRPLFGKIAQRTATPSDFAALAHLRGLSIEALRLASERGLLRFGEHRNRPAWFILDRSHRVAQARRMDGQPWAEIGGKKAWTLAGSQAAWPVGIGEAAPFPVVALCEGGPDLLAAFHFILKEQRQSDCAPVAMLGGCARIHPDALPLFDRKRVRIFRHADATGEDAVNRWAKQLADAGAEVDAFCFDGLRRVDGAPVKDLNDLAAIQADDFETHRCLWNLFPNASND